jgi:avidin family protein
MSVTGVWVNKSMSILLLHEHADGALAGKFRSIVGRDPSVRILTGRTSPVENGKQMLGFAVQFQIEEPGPGYGHYSVCTWSGWAMDKVASRTITTHWLLTVSRLREEDEWSSTTTGYDTFEKVLDSPEEKYLSADRQTLEQLLAKSRIRVD